MNQSSFHYTKCAKKFVEWYQKTKKNEDTNKLSLVVFKIIGFFHNTLLATLIKLLETVSKDLFKNRSQNDAGKQKEVRRSLIMSGVLLVDSQPKHGSFSVVTFPS